MRCNIFKPISNDTGEFLMFSQYTDDLTKEDPAKGSYRVVPSRFAALRLTLGNATTGFIKFINDNEGNPIDQSDPDVDTQINKYISQYLQSYYENMVCTVKERLGKDENNEMYWDLDKNDGSLIDGYASQLLWKTLLKLNLISVSSIQVPDSGESFATFPELKFIGDINIHSDRQADGMNYNDIYCYISPNDDEKYYKLNPVTGFKSKDGPQSTFNLLDNEAILGWTQASYPVNNGGIDWHPRSDSGSYNISGYYYPAMPTDGVNTNSSYNRHAADESNTMFSFNCIIVFYDIYNDLDQDNPVMIHYNRPAGIYFTGPAHLAPNAQDLEEQDTDGNQPFKNQVVKYISHEDIFSQGTGWSVRLMTRVVATPNASSYAMVVDGGDDYSTIAGAMGQIANAIADIRTDMKLQSENYQLMKDHLASFKNYRTNIPYVRTVFVVNEGPVEFWFVNGRNTGQRVYPIE